MPTIGNLSVSGSLEISGSTLITGSLEIRNTLTQPSVEFIDLAFTEIDASETHYINWTADLFTDHTIEVSNLAEGASLWMYVNNTQNSLTPNTVTIIARQTDVGAFQNINFAQNGALAITGKQISLNGGAAMFHIVNVRGTFVGSIH